jgi:hypothetical protein
MNTTCHKFLSILLGLSTLAIGTSPSMATSSTMKMKSTKWIAASDSNICRFQGTWGSPGNKYAHIQQLDNGRVNILINYGDRAARTTKVAGNLIDDSTLEVKFPEGTLTGTLDGNGNLNWSNGTSWNSNPPRKVTNLTSSWKHGDQTETFSTRHVGDGNFKLVIAKRGQPNRKGHGRGSSLTMQFPGAGTLNGTLVTPTCIKWSNNTTWIKTGLPD